MDERPDEQGPAEVGIVGDLTDNAADLHEKLINVPHGGECILYFDSPGGSPYCAASLMSLLIFREICATGIVTGECSSAALWLLAACRRRIVTPYSVMLFHPMRWQSEEHVQLPEAAEWARHFAHLEQQMEQLLARMLNISRARLEQWLRPGSYVTGPEFAQAGLAELVDPAELCGIPQGEDKAGRDAEFE